MGGLKRPGASARPRTFAGRWLREAMLDRRDERDRLVSTLNRGSATGWNDDEPAVVEAAAELALRRYFGPGVTDPEKESSLGRVVTAGFSEIKTQLNEQHAYAGIRSAWRRQTSMRSSRPKNTFLGDSWPPLHPS